MQLLDRLAKAQYVFGKKFKSQTREIRIYVVQRVDNEKFLLNFLISPGKSSFFRVNINLFYSYLYGIINFLGVLAPEYPFPFRWHTIPLDSSVVKLP